MAESADALDSGSSARKGVEVQVLLAAPNHLNPNRSRQIFLVGEGFGFALYLEKNNGPGFCLIESTHQSKQEKHTGYCVFDLLAHP